VLVCHLLFKSRMTQKTVSLKEAETTLHQDGFHHTYVWSDGPGAYYSEHTHPTVTAHIILDGEMDLTMQGKTYHLKAGDRCDVPANTIHTAKMGPKGCTYLIGEPN
jgi:quercetin dioxygenase-like cupin family protein